MTDPHDTHRRYPSRITTRLSPRLHAALRRVALAHDLQESEVVRAAVRRELDRLERAGRPVAP